MAAVNVVNISTLNNPGKFTDNLAFEITFECVSALKEGACRPRLSVSPPPPHPVPPLLADLEWKVVYVGSATSPKYDQELDSVLVGPVPLGTSRFVLDVPPPDPKKIPDDDLLGATVAMVTCSYGGKEFIRIGYWISNSYAEPLAEGTWRTERARESPPPTHTRSLTSHTYPFLPFRAGESAPKPCPPEKVLRNILADRPRVTRWTIPWDN
jgi:histone chaperone ASF1